MVPLRAGVLSALGLLIAPPAYDIVRTHKIPLEELDAASTGALVEDMAESVASLLKGLDSEGELRFARGVDVGYIGQSYQVTVPLDGAVEREAIWQQFATLYREKYGYFYDDVPAEIVNLRVLGELVGGELGLEPLPVEPGAGAVAVGTRPAWSARERRMRAFSVFDRDRLRPGMTFDGPAIVEEASATTIVDDGGKVEVDAYGSLVIAVDLEEAPLSANQPPEALDIVWPRLIAIADEMATTMFRTAFSHDVVEVHDMSTGLYDDRGCLIGQTWLGATGHTGVMPVYGRSLLEYFPPETVRPGDVYICNDPWICNGQTADVFITTPAFRGERLIGFSINSVHHVDIGGRKGSGLSEEVYEEGLIIPPLKLYDDGAPNEQLFAILRRNVRFAEKMIGDLHAQVAAGWSGSRELVRLATEFGLDSLRGHADEIMRRTEAGMRAGIAALPDGEYHEEMEMEIEGIAEPQTLAVTVRIEGSDVYADFTGTAAQVRRPVNCPYTRAYVALPLKLVCDPILPNNQGTYEPLHLSVPEGTLLNPTFPAACFWRLSAGMLVSELMFRVLSRIAPDRVPADSGSMPTWQFYVNGVRPNGEAFALHQHAFGGMGGRPGDDGLASVSFPYNVRDVSIEWSEMETPVLYEARELIADSGGAGEFRGGLGQELILQAYGGRVRKGEPLVLSGSAGRMRFPPRGLGGGRDGSYGAIEVNGEGIAPSSSPNVTFQEGDVVRLRLPGGGGYGDPARRRRERIEADLEAGYVTPEGARRDYGYE